MRKMAVTSSDRKRCTRLADRLAFGAAALSLAISFIGGADGCGRSEPAANGYSVGFEPASRPAGKATDAALRPAEVDLFSLHPNSDPLAACACAKAAQRNAWCRRCNVGYIAGHRVESANLFEALDPHGHEVDLNVMDCESCRRASASGGYCVECRIGFVNGLAYFTRLTWGVAQGIVVTPEDFPCEQCRSFVTRTGWCETCGRGVVGNVVLTDRDNYLATAREYATMLAAIEKVPACDWCACAMVLHSTCPMCLISYESDFPKPVSTNRPSPAG